MTAAAAVARPAEAAEARPRRPAEGWLTLALVALMVLTIAWSIDDPRWVLGRDDYTDFLAWVALLGVGWGFVSAKVGWPRWLAHLLGAIVAALAVPILVGMVLAPADGSVGAWFTAASDSAVEAYLDLAVRGRVLTQEVGHFLLVLGFLVWATGQFASYAVFGHRRPMPAVVVTGLVLLVNMSITDRDQLAYLVIFSLAALLLLTRLHALDERASWIRRSIGDPAAVAGLYVRGGTVFVTGAVLGALVLTGTASSSPLAGLWVDIDQRLIDLSQGIQRFLPRGGSGSRISGVSFGPNTAITGRWVTDATPALIVRVPLEDTGRYYWRAVTYDRFDLNGWSFSETAGVARDPGAALLADTSEDPGALEGRRTLDVTVVPLEYRGRAVFSPGVPLAVSSQARVDLIGPGLYLGGVETTDDRPSSYVVRASIPIVGDKVPGGLTENRLRASGTDYPDDIKRLYLQVPAGAVGQSALQLLSTIATQARAENAYDFARAAEAYLRSKVFTYNADVTDLPCGGDSVVECFARLRQGYCQYYASTMAVLLRVQGIPTRLVQGFLPGDRDPRTGEELIRYSNSHAWVEVYFPGYGWVDFDPTGGGVAQLGPLPSGAPVATAPPTPRGSRDPDEDLGAIDPRRSSRPDPAGGGLGSVGDGFGRFGAAGYIIVAVLLVVGVGGLAFLAWQRGPRGVVTPDGAWRGVTGLAGRLGYGPRPTQTVFEYSGSLGDVLPVARSDLHVVAAAKVEVAYGGRSLGADRLVGLRAAQRRLRVALLRLAFRRDRRGRPRR